MVMQHHPNCQNTECKICLDDAFMLEVELLKRTGMEKKYIDILGRYRTYLDSLGIKAETEHGWPHPNVYDEINISAFVLTYHEE